MTVDMHLFSNSNNTKQCPSFPACDCDATYNELPDQENVFNLEQQQFRKNCSVICRPQTGELSAERNLMCALGLICLMTASLQGMFLERCWIHTHISQTVCMLPQFSSFSQNSGNIKGRVFMHFHTFWTIAENTHDWI